MHYTPEDDGKVIGGKIVVWITPAVSSGESGTGSGTVGTYIDYDKGGAAGEEAAADGAAAGGSAVPMSEAAEQLQLEAVQDAAAASLTTAAEKGVPFCEECDAARKAQAAA